jgi:hypothetical protein
MEKKKKEEEEEKLVMRIRGMEVVRKTPLNGERLAFWKDVEIPLAPIRREIKRGEKTRKFSLRVVRDYVNLNFKKELIEAEARGKKVVYETSFLGKIFGFKGKRKVIRSDEVKNFVWSHIRSTKPFPPEIGVVALAFYLKEFLEVVFGIEEELTYKELAEIIKGKAIEEKLKGELYSFFNSISEQIYEGKITLDYNKCYELAEKVLKEFLEKEG